MKEILLTQGRIALVDDEDFERLNQWKWHVDKNPNGDWVAKRKQHRDECSQAIRQTITMSRQIMSAPPNLLVDHINGNTLDNRRENLRLCNYAENQWNRHHAWGTSKFKGVSWEKRRNKWKAVIAKNKQDYFLGEFESEIEAAKAYDEKALELYGEFARLNHVEV